MPKETKEAKSDLFALVSQVKDNFDEFRQAADEKKAELEDLRATLWEILGPPPMADCYSGAATQSSRPSKLELLEEEIIHNLKWVVTNLDQKNYSVALGRIKSTLIMLTGKNP